MVFATAIAMGLAAASAAASPATVQVKDIDFKPHVLKIDKGSRVTWKFQEQYTRHNVHSVGKKHFKSSADKHFGETYAVTFRRTGTFRYVCTIHPGMKAKVVVS